MKAKELLPSKRSVGGAVSALLLSGCTTVFKQSSVHGDIWRNYSAPVNSCYRTIENVTSLGSSISTTITMPAPCS